MDRLHALLGNLFICILILGAMQAGANVRLITLSPEQILFGIILFALSIAATDTKFPVTVRKVFLGLLVLAILAIFIVPECYVKGIVQAMAGKLPLDFKCK